MEELSINNYKNNKGLTKIDIIHLSIIIVMIIIYIILIYQNTYNEPKEMSSEQKQQQDTLTKNNEPIDNNVTNLDIIISIWGLILGLFISSFVTRFIFREYRSNISIITITFFISITFLIIYYISINYRNTETNKPWITYNQIIFPLIGGLFLISEDSINHFLDYFGGNESKYSTINFSKIIGGINDIRSALDKNNILSDTSTDYMGSSDILSENFSSQYNSSD